MTTPNGTATTTGDFIIPPPSYAVADVMLSGRMSIGGSSTPVNVNTIGKIGLMLFDGSQGQRVYLNITSVSVTGNAYVNIYNPDRTLLVSKTVSYINSSFIDATALPATGTYTIMVDPWSSATGTVTLTLYNVLPDITGPITPGGASVPISLTTPGQNSRLSFNGTTAQRVSLRLTGVTIGSSTIFTIFNPNGTTLVWATAHVGFGGWIDATTLPTAGTYTILVNPSSNYTGNATLALYDVVDINSSITPGGGSVPVTITTPGQNARYTFSGTTGQMISLNITGVTALGTNVYIYKPDGSTLASAINVVGAGAFIDTKILPASGTYTILVDPQVYTTGNVTLSLYDIVDVTGPITVGGSAVPTTVANPGQNGTLTFAGTSGQQVTVRITSNTMSIVTVKLLKPDGTTMTTSTSSASSFNLAQQTLATTGTYTIKIDPNTFNTGSMNVSVTSP